jgi:hypothetical protein
MIKHEKVTGFPLDNMVHFGEMLMDLERREPGKEKVIWKSDVAEAYHILPMHPRWQAKQVTRVDDEYFVDRCNVFGGCGAGGIFISFNASALRSSPTDRKKTGTEPNHNRSLLRPRSRFYRFSKSPVLGPGPHGIFKDQLWTG